MRMTWLVSRAHLTACRWSLAMVLMAATVPAFAAGKPLPAQWQHVADMFDATLQNDRMVGGSIALVENGKIVARRDYGYADQAGGRKVDADTIFHWASNTKTINAITVMQLRDRGLLSLEDSVTRRVPELRRMHNPFGSMDAITIRMLLTHSAGFQDSTWPYKRGEAWEPFEPTRWEQLVAMMPYQEVEFAPGSKFSYSNPAWIYLARILEDLTNDPWVYYVQKNVFAPLGMSRSYFGITPAYLRANRSHSYYIHKNADQEVTDDLGGDFDPGITIPNGGWNAPLADVATYIGFLTGAAGGDTQVKQRYDSVLKRATLEEMWQPRLPVSSGDDAKTPNTDQMGLAFFVMEQGGRRIVGHTGGQAAFATFFYCDPQTGRGVIGAFNTANSQRVEGAASAFAKIRSEALKVFQ